MTGRQILILSLVFLTVILAAATGVGISYLRHRPAEEPVREPGPIIAFGDSLAAGVGAPDGSRWIDMVEDELGIEIVNAGVPGDTSEEAGARIGPDVLSRNPRAVIVLVGGNDVLGGVPSSITFRNLENIARRIGPGKVLLLGIPGSLFADPFRAEFERIAEETESGLVPNILEGILGNPDLMADDVHPNRRGQEKMAERIIPALEELLNKQQ